MNLNGWGYVSNLNIRFFARQQAIGDISPTNTFSSDVQNPDNGTVTGKQPFFGTRWFIARLSMVYGRYN